MPTDDQVSGILELHWGPLDPRCTIYQLYFRTTLGQLRFIDAFEQGPFDTCVDVAQWAWRSIARQVRPSD